MLANSKNFMIAEQFESRKRTNEYLFVSVFPFENGENICINCVFGEGRVKSKDDEEFIWNFDIHV